jgi:hypothetical protein
MLLIISSDLVVELCEPCPTGVVSIGSGTSDSAS